MDSSINKESDLPAADPSTPIPLKYEEWSQNGAKDVEKEIALLLDRGRSPHPFTSSETVSSSTIGLFTLFILGHSRSV